MAQAWFTKTHNAIIRLGKSFQVQSLGLYSAQKERGNCIGESAQLQLTADPVGSRYGKQSANTLNTTNFPQLTIHCGLVKIEGAAPVHPLWFILLVSSLKFWNSSFLTRFIMSFVSHDCVNLAYVYSGVRLVKYN